jgi:hypothetical protein
LFESYGRPSKFEFDSAAEKGQATLAWETDIPTLKTLGIEAFAPETITKFKLLISSDALNTNFVPVILAKV